MWAETSAIDRSVISAPGCCLHVDLAQLDIAAESEVIRRQLGQRIDSQRATNTLAAPSPQPGERQKALNQACDLRSKENLEESC